MPRTYPYASVFLVLQTGIGRCGCPVLCRANLNTRRKVLDFVQSGGPPFANRTSEVFMYP